MYSKYTCKETMHKKEKILCLHAKSGRQLSYINLSSQMFEPAYILIEPSLKIHISGKLPRKYGKFFGPVLK